MPLTKVNGQMLDGAITADSSGNVGIGTSSPAAKLNVVGGNIRLDNNQGVEWGGGNNYIYGNETTDIVVVATNGNERMRIDSSGNVGIGTSTTNAGRLSVVNSSGNCGVNIDGQSATGTGAFLRLRKGGVDTGFLGQLSALIGTGTSSDLTLYTEAGINQLFYTGGAERMRIDSSGNLCLGINGQMNSGKQSIEFSGFTQNGITLRTTYASLGSAYLAFYNSANQTAGTITQNGTTTVAYNTSSDYRLKENIQPMVDALAKIAQLKPVTYKWKSDGSDGQGFIAHELQAVVPDCVTGEKDAIDAEGNPKYQGVDTSFLVATLTAAIQELKAELDATKAEVAELKAKGQ